MTPGTKSSEFVSAWMAAIVGGGYGLSSDEPMVQAAGLLGSGIAIGLYALGRGIAKRGKAS